MIQVTERYDKISKSHKIYKFLKHGHLTLGLSVLIKNNQKTISDNQIATEKYDKVSKFTKKLAIFGQIL